MTWNDRWPNIDKEVCPISLKRMYPLIILLLTLTVVRIRHHSVVASVMICLSSSQCVAVCVCVCVWCAWYIFLFTSLMKRHQLLWWLCHVTLTVSIQCRDCSWVLNIIYYNRLHVLSVDYVYTMQITKKRYNSQQWSFNHIKHSTDNIAVCMGRSKYCTGAREIYIRYSCTMWFTEPDLTTALLVMNIIAGKGTCMPIYIILCVI